jgi:tetratricopeptide (TPR) repeat protein
MQALGYTYGHLNRYPAAERLLKHTAELMTNTLGATHPETLNTRNGLADICRLMGQHDEAAQMQRSVVNGLKMTLGSDHISVLYAICTLARIYRKQGRFADAEAMLVEAVRKQRKLFGPHHRDTVYSIRDLGLVLSDSGKLEEADKVFRDILLVFMQTFGVRHGSTHQLQSLLGQNLLRQGRLPEARSVLMNVLDWQLSASVPNQSDISFTERRLGCVHIEQGHTNDGILILLTAADRFDSLVGMGHPETLETMQLLVDAYRQSDRFREAEEMEREIVTRRAQTFREQQAENEVEFGWERRLVD